MSNDQKFKLGHHCKVPPHIVPSDIRVSGNEYHNFKHIYFVFDIIYNASSL